MDEIMLSVHYTDSTDSTDNAGEFPFESEIDALDLASNLETWRDTSGREIGFVMLWVNADCLETFYSQEEALATYEQAVGRC